MVSRPSSAGANRKTSEPRRSRLRAEPSSFRRATPSMSMAACTFSDCEAKMNAEVEVKIAGHVAEILLNRPKKLNAVTPKMAAALEKICLDLDRNDDVRVVLLRGEGERAFCAGSDLGALAEYPSAWAFRNRVEYATA